MMLGAGFPQNLLILLGESAGLLHPKVRFPGHPSSHTETTRKGSARGESLDRPRNGDLFELVRERFHDVWAHYHPP
jgi:hypothetical protein